MVDLAAIRHNVRLLRELVGAGRDDDRGQGRRLRPRDGRGGAAPPGRPAPSWLGVATHRRGARSCATAGDTGRILCWLGGARARTTPAAIAADVDVTAYTVAELAEIAAGAPAGRPARLQLKVDTGLSRGGATLGDWPDVVDAAARRRARPATGPSPASGRTSRAATSPTTRPTTRRRRRSATRSTSPSAAGLGPRCATWPTPLPRSCARSSRFDLVRCGIASYGLDPAPGVTPDLGLVPAMTARGRRWRWSSRSRPAQASPTATPGPPTATPRSAWCRSGTATACPGTPATAPRSWSAAGAGRSAAGSAWTSSWSTSATTLPAAGDEVVLFGTGADGEPTAQDWAEACGTISYEIVTRIGGRFARRYVDEEERPR